MVAMHLTEINKSSTMILEDKYSNSLHDSKHDYITIIILFNSFIITFNNFLLTRQRLKRLSFFVCSSENHCFRLLHRAHDRRHLTEVHPHRHQANINVFHRYC